MIRLKSAKQALGLRGVIRTIFLKGATFPESLFRFVILFCPEDSQYPPFKECEQLRSPASGSRSPRQTRSRRDQSRA